MNHAATDLTPLPSPGEELQPRTYGPLTRTDIVRYAGASGDFNPIHHDEPFATAAGFPTVFSIGMYQAGILAGYVVEQFGAATVRRFTVRFQEPVYPGDELTCQARITTVASAHDRHRLEVELEGRRQTGGLAVTGTAVFELPE